MSNINAQIIKLVVLGLCGFAIGCAIAGLVGCQRAQYGYMKSGTDGKNGVDGTNGSNGTNGVNGQDGQAGQSCSVEQNGDSATIQCGDSMAVVSVPPTQEPTYLCHIPPGNPDKAHSIYVPQVALAAHLAHGDYEGECQ